MSDKTCGTCRKGVRAVLCNKCSPIGEIRSFDDKACGKYEECTASVEQVIHEILSHLDPVDAKEYRDRLYALGAGGC